MPRFAKAALAALGLTLLVAACGGGGGGGGSTATTSTTTPAAPALTNFTTVTVDAGPAALNTGTNPYTSLNSPFVSVTLCAPGTSNCQTIDHVLLDTGSVGLRVFASLLTPSLLAAMPTQTDASANPTGECYGFVDGYMFGSVRSADFKIGGEAVAGMPFLAIADTGVFATVPRTCSSGGGTALATVKALGANGIIGVGVTPTDCGSQCASAGGYGAAIYYDCPSTGCSSVIGRASSTTAPFQQLPNPVAAMPLDNNGTIVSLPSLPASGAPTATGTVYFGIGTQTNNGLGTATILITTGSTSRNGAGLISVSYKSKTLSQSYIDSGSNLYIFVDASIPGCTRSGYTGFYCPASPLSLSATLTGQNAASAVNSFTLYNAQTLDQAGYSAQPGVGGNPNQFSTFSAVSNSFDFGLPFFYGRNVYTAIEGMNAGGTMGPYFAF